MTVTATAPIPVFDATRPVQRSEAPAAPADTRGEGEEATEGETAAFTPDTADKADWLLGKIADARARAARVRENAEKIARAHDAEADGLEFRFGPALQAFTQKELAGGRRKSLRLLNGVLGYRTRPAAVSFTNPVAALEYARQNVPAAVVESLDKKALSAALLDTGEAVDGAFCQPEEETLYIK